MSWRAGLWLLCGISFLGAPSGCDKQAEAGDGEVDSASELDLIRPESDTLLDEASGPEDLEALGDTRYDLEDAVPDATWDVVEADATRTDVEPDTTSADVGEPDIEVTDTFEVVGSDDTNSADGDGGDAAVDAVPGDDAVAEVADGVEVFEEVDAPGDASDPEEPPPALPSCMRPVSSQAPIAALVGHTSAVVFMARDAQRVVTRDAKGLWVVWDLGTMSPLGYGTVACASTPGCVGTKSELRGATLAIQDGTAVDLRDVSALAQPATRVTVGPGAIGLSLDGQYLWEASGWRLAVWNRQGIQVFEKEGYFYGSSALVLGDVVYAPRTIDGVSYVASYDLTTGSERPKIPYSGSFAFWFEDGSKFVVTGGATSFIYDRAGTLASTLGSGGTPVGGSGDWLWTSSGGFFRISTASWVPPVAVPLGVTGTRFVVASTELVELGGEIPQVLSGFIGAQRFAVAASGTSWVALPTSGWEARVSEDGDSGRVRSMGCGGTTSIAGSEGGRTVIVNSNQQVSLFDVVDGKMRSLHRLSGSALRAGLSREGRVMAWFRGSPTSFGSGSVQVFEAQADGEFVETVRVDSPDGVLETGAELAASGSCFSFTSYVVGEGNHRFIYDIQGVRKFWAILRNGDGMRLSPTCAHWVFSAVSATWTTSFWSDGALTGSFPGRALGWLDDTRLVLGSVASDGTTTTPNRVVSPMGAYVMDLNLPQGTGRLELAPDLTPETVYHQSAGAMFDLVTGAEVWRGQLPTNGLGTLSGGSVVYTSGPWLVIEPY